MTTKHWRSTIVLGGFMFLQTLEPATAQNQHPGLWLAGENSVSAKAYRNCLIENNLLPGMIIVYTHTFDEKSMAAQPRIERGEVNNVAAYFDGMARCATQFQQNPGSVNPTAVAALAQFIDDLSKLGHRLSRSEITWKEFADSRTSLNSALDSRLPSIVDSAKGATQAPKSTIPSATLPSSTSSTSGTVPRAAKVFAAKPNTASSVCFKLSDDYEFASKQLAMSYAEGIGDDSAPRATMREARNSNVLERARITLDLMRANNCKLPTEAPSLKRYLSSAMSCVSQRMSAGTASSCEMANWPPE